MKKKSDLDAEKCSSLPMIGTIISTTFHYSVCQVVCL
jgi:hypothetical protein